jgi:hypothetical protein
MFRILVLFLSFMSVLKATAAHAEISLLNITGQDCKIQNHSIPNGLPVVLRSITWTGNCRDNKADGEGSAMWIFDFDAGAAAKHVPALFDALKGQTITYQYDGHMVAGRIEGAGKLVVVATAKGWYAETREGEFEGGLLNGMGKLYEEQFLRYEGSFKDGVYDGEGTLYEHADRNVKKEDLPTVTAGRVIYQGGLKNGSFHGRGTISWRSGNKFEGNFNLGKITNGRYSYANGNYYDATWRGQSPLGEFPCFWDGKHTICKGYFGKDNKRGEVRPIE